MRRYVTKRRFCVSKRRILHLGAAAVHAADGAEAAASGAGSGTRSSSGSGLGSGLGLRRSSGRSSGRSRRRSSGRSRRCITGDARIRSKVPIASTHGTHVTLARGGGWPATLGFVLDAPTELCGCGLALTHSER
jgi:hypothetical protein